MCARLSLALSLSLAVLACGGSSKKPDSTTPPAGDAPAPQVDAPPPATDAQADELLAIAKQVFPRLTQVFRDHPSDCKALAAALRAWSAENGEAWQRLNSEGRSLTPAQQERAAAEVVPLLEELSEAMAPAEEQCEDDPDVRDAMRAL